MKRIRRLGRYFQKGVDGRLLNDCDRVFLPPWDKVIADFRLMVEQDCSMNLSSVYVRGSVARGLAVLGVSDLDAIIVTNTAIARRHREEWEATAEAAMTARHPFLKRIDLIFVDSDSLFNSAYCAGIRFTLKTMSTPIAGPDARGMLQDYYPNRDIAFFCSSLVTDMALFQHESHRSPHDRQVSFLRWILRRIIRAGGELGMIHTGRYSPDLYFCFKLFEQVAPRHSHTMRSLLQLAIDPIPSKTNVALARRIADTVTGMFAGLTSTT